MIESVSLSVPGVEVFNQILATIDLDAFAPLFGFKIDGIIGHDFIHNFVVEIDYASGVMNLFDPQSYKYHGAGESIPIEIVAGIKEEDTIIAVDGQPTARLTLRELRRLFTYPAPKARNMIARG